MKLAIVYRKVAARSSKTSRDLSEIVFKIIPRSEARLSIDAKAVNDLIARNARVAQDQKEYNERYDALVSRYEETERRRDGVAEQIDQIMIRRRKIERFIESVKDLPELITKFDAGQWACLVESMTVYDKDRIVWKLTCGMEIES